MRKTIIITDPIHQVMNLGSDPDLRQCIKDVLDTRTFQRLRRITQLGLASYVFPGATHTRFSHSLGVAYLAHSALTHLRESAPTPKDQAEIDTSIFNLVVMAALLHDVGHGPFSHSFEQVLKGKDYKWAPLHEDWTRTFISYNESEIHQKLIDNNIDISSISSIFTESSEQLPKLGLAQPFREIVSSQLDVDRMDYLVRDSHFAGVAVGRFDVHYLIHSLVIASHGENGVKTLGIRPKGVKAYEGFLLARQLMNRTVYYHHHVKVLEFMVEHFLRLIIDNMQVIAHKSSPIARFIPPYLKRVSMANKKPSLNKDTFMIEAYQDYIRLTEDSIWSLISSAADHVTLPIIQNLADKLLRRKILPHFVVHAGKGDLLQNALIDNKLVKDTDFHLLNLKTTMYEGKDDKRVFVVDWEGSISEVGQKSDMISAFRDRPEAEAVLVVINADKEDAIKELGKKGQFIIVQ